MANTLYPIPLKTPIVFPKTGAINIFFRQAWEALRVQLGLVPSVGSVDLPVAPATLGAAVTGQLLYTVTQAGLYRVTYYVRKTRADGAASSLAFTWHWTESGVPLSKTGAALTTDTTGAAQSESMLLEVDANTNLTFDTVYASTTPGQMLYRVSVRVEQVN